MDGEDKKVDESIDENREINGPEEDNKEEFEESKIERGFEDSVIGERKEDNKKGTSKINIDEDNKDIEGIQNKQIKWSVFLMVSIIFIIVVVPFINNNFINKFDYNGLTFQKTQLGDLIFYSTRFPVVRVTGQIVGDNAINLRNDPRDLEYIPVNVTNDRIDFVRSRSRYAPVYIALDPFMDVCEDTGIALIALSGFLRDSGLEVKSAVIDKDYAKENNQTHRVCDTAEYDTLIIIRVGNQTTINEIQPNCYEMRFNNCEILQVSEKFILTILKEYVDRFEIK